MKIISIIVAVSLAIVFVAAPAYSTTRYPNPAVPNSIDTALKASVSGDMIELTPGGIYNEHFQPEYPGPVPPQQEQRMLLAYKDNITIYALLDELYETIIDAQGLGACLLFYNCSNLKIRGITFKNGNATGPHDDVHWNAGGGIYIHGCQDMIIEKCDFQDNTAERGGGVFAFQSDISFARPCDCSGNTATTDGGGMYFDGTSVHAANVNFLSNFATAGNGAGLWCGQASVVTVIDGKLEQNDATSAGGGVYVSDSASVEFCGTSIIFNKVGGTIGYDGHIADPAGQVFINPDFIPGWWHGDHDPINVPAGDCPARMVTYEDSPLEISICNFPDGTGYSFSHGFNPNELFQVDGTITVRGLEDGVDLKEHFWLDFQGPPSTRTIKFDPAVNSGKHVADYDPSAGKTKFENPCRSGGTAWYPDHPCIIQTPSGPITSGDYPALIYFNSPDITGNGVVGVEDWLLYKIDYRILYNYRSDFKWDEHIDMSDLVIFQSAYGKRWY